MLNLQNNNDYIYGRLKNDSIQMLDIIVLKIRIPLYLNTPKWTLIS